MLVVLPFAVLIGGAVWLYRVHAMPTWIALICSGAVFGGPGLEWWLGWRLLPLLLPAVGLAGGLVGGVALMKRANRQIGGSKTEPVSLTAGDHQPERLGPGA